MSGDDILKSLVSHKYELIELMTLHWGIICVLCPFIFMWDFNQAIYLCFKKNKHRFIITC